MPLSKQVVADLTEIVKKIPKEKTNFIKDVFSQDALDVIQKNKLVDVGDHKSPKEIIYHFFGMNSNWKLGRNLIGGFMVHSPEYPTYFIPAFTQAKATGDSSELKKGEGPRGLITGGLEGIAVGALVSGEFIKPREMIPYIVLGAGLQFLSSKLFPWLGEKCGQYIYNKRMSEKGQGPVDLSESSNDSTHLTPFSDVNVPKSSPKFAGRSQYNTYQSRGMKI